MKHKWVLIWWDDEKDCERKKFYPSHEAAITALEKLKRRSNGKELDVHGNNQ